MAKAQDTKSLLSSTDDVKANPDDIIQFVTTNNLANFLRKHGLYSDLFHILHGSGIDLEMLQNLKFAEIDEFCNESGLNLRQKLKFRQLMKIIDELKKSTTSVANDRHNHINDIAMDQTVKKGQQSLKQKRLAFDDRMTVVLMGDSHVGKTSLLIRF